MVFLLRLVLLAEFVFLSKAFLLVNHPDSKHRFLEHTRKQPTTATPTAFTTCRSMSSSSTTTEIPSYKYVAEGMELFRQGDVEGSIKSFDKSVPPGSKAYLWQRGLSYYYADDFAKGSQQFRDDVLRSPLDVEEIVWDIACLLRIDPTTFPPSNMLSLPPGRTDRRPIMATVYSLFRGEANERDLAEAGHKGGPSEEFYALLYLGLFNEARGESGKAENYMRSAVKTKYAMVVGSKDYMVDVAKIHCKLRHWNI